MNLGWNLLAGVAAGALLMATAKASIGDKDEKYNECLADCIRSELCHSQRFQADTGTLLRLFGWSCQAECRYKCMWKMIEEQRHPSPVQYYGKWPFRRVLGMQEIASVVFSIGNLAAHLYGYHRIYLVAAEKTPAWFMHWVVRLQMLLSINAWTWSIVFHARDVGWTERMDYFSAISLVFTALYAGIIRCFGIRRGRRQIAIFAVLAAVLALHIFRMAVIKFDFSLNLMLAITLALSKLVLFLGWSGIHLAKGLRPHCWWAVAAVLGTIAGATLEIFDFPPIAYMVDAHSLWHACTIPIALAWYKFYAADRIYDTLTVSKTSKTLHLP